MFTSPSAIIQWFKVHALTDKPASQRRPQQQHASQGQVAVNRVLNGQRQEIPQQRKSRFSAR